MKQKSSWQLLLGAAFLMATSAIGPGFLVQTTVFTQSLLASFGFVILISILLDIGAQLNVWRIIAVSERKAQDIANTLLPGLGYFIALLVMIGGFAFNIGNVGGAGLGLNVIFGGLSPQAGAAISGAIAISIFLVKEAGKAMDRFALIAGFVMVALTVYVAIVSSPPVGEAVVKTFVPDKIDFAAIVTLVGGTVGGYITFAGGHRLLDAGVKGEEAIGEVNKSAVSAIGIASIMRIFLFLAALGVIASGVTLDPGNPPASVFKHAAGNIGYKIFGIVMWSAAVTSIVGAAYTSVSFIRSFHPRLEKYGNLLIVVFILLSTIIFIQVGNPVRLLVFVGALNGLILPITLGVMLVAAYNKNIVGSYRHPLWMTLVGAVISIGMAVMGVLAFLKL
ncbi:Mn2+ and Fe2+ transporters of the NRAMP family [Fictibacillus solisalsi]|uniref:Mn2+ and Fe2+ transporters of the NRAMP family n=1 Tax=Fictibacillus solisalsi TaxID=459525 RepID=A0A1G9VB16_9BACL|nr:NRAMP family divalent metal transporter [Fictibacillus solisalsi]SDM69359.1 Mn2+ and Fe2+ transporters of the NRAMP family [Fictibacillus solisalsi]